MSINHESERRTNVEPASNKQLFDKYNQPASENAPQAENTSEKKKKSKEKEVRQVRLTGRQAALALALVTAGGVATGVTINNYGNSSEATPNTDKQPNAEAPVNPGQAEQPGVDTGETPVDPASTEVPTGQESSVNIPTGELYDPTTGELNTEAIDSTLTIEASDNPEVLATEVSQDLTTMINLINHADITRQSIQDVAPAVAEGWWNGNTSENIIDGEFKDSGYETVLGNMFSVSSNSTTYSELANPDFVYKMDANVEFVDAPETLDIDSGKIITLKGKVTYRDNGSGDPAFEQDYNDMYTEYPGDFVATQDIEMSFTPLQGTTELVASFNPTSPLVDGEGKEVPSLSRSSNPVPDNAF